MSLADDLYRETILDHYHHPRNQGKIESPSARTEGTNPLCGDEVTLYLTVDGDRITDIKLESHGCSINTASGSMMTEAVIGQPISQAHEVIALIKNMLTGKCNDETFLPEELEDLEALQGVKKYPVRIKCALLPWNTMLEALASASTESGGNGNQENRS